MAAYKGSIILLALGIIHLVTCTSPTKPPITQECYTAAVYETLHAEDPYDPEIRSTKDIIKNNVELYKKAGEEAKKQGADILVFPELGLYNAVNSSREIFRGLAEDIPAAEESKIPCDHPKDYRDGSFLVAISCLAKTHKMYVVINAGDRKPCDRAKDPQCPDDGLYVYNTNIAFDRNGKIVARYHKTHPYFEPMHNASPKNEYVYFDTEFGRMGTVICFDLVFKEIVRLVEDYQIDTLIFPTWWFDGQPFLVATQIQQAFAIVNKVNFVASNVQRPDKGTLGSGIYAGVNGAVNYVHKADGKPRLLVSRIPSKSGPGKVCKDPAPSKQIEFENPNTKKIANSPIPYYTGFTANISQYAFAKLSRPEDKIEVCHNGFCCQLEYELKKNRFDEGEQFYFGVYNGTDDVFQHYFWAIEACVLAKGDPRKRPPESQFASTSNTVFKRVEIRGQFSTRYVYPSVLGKELSLVQRNKWTYATDGFTKVSLITVSNVEEPIVTVGLYGRAYDRDPEYRQ